MMNENNIKKMEALLAEEEFAIKIEGSGSYEKAYALFVEEGVTVSYEEFMDFIHESEKAMKSSGLISEEGELGPELLEMVSGGGKGAAIATWVVAGVAWYVCPPAGVVLWLVGGCVWGSK